MAIPLPPITILACVSVALAVICAVWTALDELRPPQQMAIMNVVSPVAVLYSGALGLWAHEASRSLH
jgi:hypothetical protein